MGNWPTPDSDEFPRQFAPALYGGKTRPAYTAEKEAAMVRNLKQIEGRALQARDGVIGEVKDVYFDDYDWHVRYLVVETGAWLHKRKVLVSPEACAGLDWKLQVFPVNLTKDQVRNSPAIDTNKPVSRQHEEALREYYGWPTYWGAVFAEGGIAAPIVAPTPAANTSEPGFTDGDTPLRQPKGDPHLRSANDTRNYHIEATDGPIGHLEDFLVDENGWRIRYLVVDTRNGWPGKKVLVAPSWTKDVSWEKRRVTVDLTRDAIKHSPPYEPSDPWNSDYAAELHDHYERPRYSDWDKDIAAGAPRLHRKR
jgi:hypothetical protein